MGRDRLPLETESVGAVWSSAVLLHLRAADVVVALREFFRVLRPGGMAQVSVKSGSGHEAQSFGTPPAGRRHFFYYQAKEIVSFAMAVGFEIADTWTGQEKDSGDTVQTWTKVLVQKPR
jgi:predicted SAM-dependent methyltransferase